MQETEAPSSSEAVWCMQRSELEKQWSSCLCQCLSWWCLWLLCPLPADSSKQLRYQTGIILIFFSLMALLEWLAQCSDFRVRMHIFFSHLILHSFISLEAIFVIYPQQKKATRSPMRSFCVSVKAPPYSNCVALDKWHKLEDFQFSNL